MRTQQGYIPGLLRTRNLRPIADLSHLVCMLHSQPALPTFAATARLKLWWTSGPRDKDEPALAVLAFVAGGAC